jgi:hypothetical protein
MVSRLLRRQASALRSNYLAAQHCLKGSSCCSSRYFATSGRGQPGAGDQSSLGIYSGDHVGRRLVKPERIIIVRHGESMGNLDEVSKIASTSICSSKPICASVECDATLMRFALAPSARCVEADSLIFVVVDCCIHCSQRMCTCQTGRSLSLSRYAPLIIEFHEKIS